MLLEILGTISLLIGIYVIITTKMDVTKAVWQRKKIDFSNKEDKDISQRFIIGAILFFGGLFLIFLSQ